VAGQSLLLEAVADATDPTIFILNCDWRYTLLLLHIFSKCANTQVRGGAVYLRIQFLCVGNLIFSDVTYASSYTNGAKYAKTHRPSLTESLEQK
jgi:hypothetical protein